MTARAMAKRILDCVKERPGATFVELVGACGKEALGNEELSLGGDGENVILWQGVSRLFSDALGMAKPNLEIGYDHGLMCYGFDGKFLNLPLVDPTATSFPTEARWLPAIFTWRRRKS